MVVIPLAYRRFLDVFVFFGCIILRTANTIRFAIRISNWNVTLENKTSFAITRPSIDEVSRISIIGTMIWAGVEMITYFGCCQNRVMIRAIAHHFSKGVRTKSLRNIVVVVYRQSSATSCHHPPSIIYKT